MNYDPLSGECFVDNMYDGSGVNQVLNQEFSCTDLAQFDLTRQSCVGTSCSVSCSSEGQISGFTKTELKEIVHAAGYKEYDLKADDLWINAGEFVGFSGCIALR